MDTHIALLRELFAQWNNAPAETVERIPTAGSHRQYFRLTGGERTAVGAYGSDVRENRAFFTIGKHLRSRGLRVPEIYAMADDEQHYLLEDFGNLSLFDVLKSAQSQEFKEQALKKTIAQLALLQINGAKGFNFSNCYPVENFDRPSIFWDLNYFKYCFLKTSGMEFDEAQIERDFESFADYLLKADASFFMYRDFQSRNIMMEGETLGFIDFQGGRRGPLQYDLASLLFQAKADYSETLRESMLQYYLDAAAKLTTIDREKFTQHYYAFVLLRTLQVLGAYGFRGLVEQKKHFIESIPFALQNAKWLIESGKLQSLHVPYLLRLLMQLISDVRYQIPDRHKEGSSAISNQQSNPLKITITSFAYKNGYPADLSGNGGGYVFDCRGLDNPGRVPELCKHTGRDALIADYLEKNSQVEVFLKSAFQLIDLSVENYLSRGFNNLGISFGCTGGQHRSVYCAERTAAHLSQTYKNVETRLVHRELLIPSTSS